MTYSSVFYNVQLFKRRAFVQEEEVRVQALALQPVLKWFEWCLFLTSCTRLKEMRSWAMVGTKSGKEMDEEGQSHSQYIC